MKTLFLLIALSFATSLFAEAEPPCPIEPGVYAYEDSSDRPLEVKCSAISGETYIIADFRDCKFARGWFRHMKFNEWWYMDQFPSGYWCNIRLFIDSKTSFRARMEHDNPKQPVFKLKKLND